MDTKNGSDQQKRPSSLLQGDGFYFNRVLSRESSVGQSSRIYYRRPEGVPFQWEMQPGTPKNGPEEQVIPPLSPPPSVLSLGLPMPCLDQLERPDHSKVWFWKKIKIIHKWRKVQTHTSKGTENVDPGLNKNDQSFQLGDQSDGEFVASFNNSCSSSSLSSISSNSHAKELSSVRRESLEGPFCCSPWNMSAILDEGDRKVYYCHIHKTAFAVENDGFSGGRFLSRVSSVDQSFRSYYRSSEGIPFRWEMQPGTSKNPPENELIPPPSPPPALQSLGLPLPKLNSDEESARTRGYGYPKMSRTWFWISSKKIQKTEKVGEISLRLENARKSCCCSDDDQNSVGIHCDLVSRSSTVSSTSMSKSRSLLKLSKFTRDVLGGQYFCFNPWNV